MPSFTPPTSSDPAPPQPAARPQPPDVVPLSGPGGQTRRDRRRLDTALGAFGIAATVLCVIAGLVVVGWFIVAALAMSRYGSNK